MGHKNVLLMVADDLGRQLGCYGDGVIKTPHLDKLASEGVKFTKAFASTASCSASRSTVYTGQHTHQNGQYGLHNGRNHFMTFGHVETAPMLMNSHGYKTGIIGKVHVGPDGVYPWQIREESGTRDVAYTSDRCDEFFKQAVSEDKPFFLTVAFIDPHRDLTRDGFGNEHSFDHRVEHVTYKPSDMCIPQFLNDTAGTRKELASYYQSISRMDQGVGMILQSLQARGLKDDTMVVFLSDNGSPFINSKTTLYDAGVNLPFIIRCPGVSGSLTNPNLVSYVDVLPTILDYTGHKSAKANSSSRTGRSLLPIIPRTEIQSGWNRVYGSHTFHEATNYWPTRFVRNQRYKYHRNLAWRLDFPMAADIYGSLSWEDVRNSEKKVVGGRRMQDFFFRPPEELYDLEQDPLELNNLAEEKDHAEILKELQGCLETWQRRTEDAWLYRDGVSVLFVRHHIDAGLVIPDRFDFDPANPGNQQGAKPYLETRFGAEVDWQK